MEPDGDEIIGSGTQMRERYVGQRLISDRWNNIGGADQRMESGKERMGRISKGRRKQGQVNA